MNLELEQRVIVITGGASGIGRATTLRIAAEGGTPVVIDPQAAQAEQVINEAKALYGTGMYIGIALDSDDACRQAIVDTLKEMGRIDGVVNNAGRNDGVGLEFGSTAEFEESLRSNLLHYFALTHHALPYLRESVGAIVNVSSKTALVGQGGTSGYVAAKGAQLALTREWALELTRYGIRVNAVIPAEVRTPAYTRWLDELEEPEKTLDQIQRQIPLGSRLTEPSEVADTIAFLLSPRASHITGQFIHVDGGYVHLDRAIGSINRNTE